MNSVDFRCYIDLIETKSVQMDLVAALDQWADGYSKDDTWQISNRAAELESRIISLSANHRPTYNGMLYRGTGILDDDYLALENGADVLYRQSNSKKLISWTKDISVARAFAKDAVETGFSSVVIAMPSYKLPVLVDIDEVLGVPNGESEVIVRSSPIVLNGSNVIEMFKYEDNK